MLVYTGTVRRFLSDCDHGDIESQVGKAVKARTGHSVSPSEKRSWRNSLREMALVLALSSSSVPKDAGVAIEYQVPLASKRVDFMVSGYNAHEEPTIVVVELKQWEKVRAVQDSGTIVETYLGGTERPTVHPSYQAWSYAAFIENYNEAVQNRDIALRPCVYLHNYERRAPDPIDAPQYKEIIAGAPVFSRKQGPNLRQFLASHIARGDDRRILEYLEGAKLRPSRKLQDEIAGMLAGNRAYIMIDDQQVAFEEIADAAIKCQKDGIKRTLILNYPLLTPMRVRLVV